jgi:predicted signal transduction protein with EAL and GGDEF domain
LKHDIDDNAIAARLGGDEFILVMPQPISEHHCHIVAQRIVQQLSAPIDLPQRDSVAVSASVGVARSPADGTNLDDLLSCADAAMYLAKKRGRSRWIRYTRGMEEHMRRRTLIVQGLDQAIASDQLELHYQEVLNTETNEMPLVEALLRWHHPQLGMLRPEEIISTAEETGKIAAVENWVMQQASKDLPRIREHLNQNARVSINVSGANLTQENFFSNLQHCINEHNLQPHDFLLELTENILVSIVENNHSP